MESAILGDENENEKKRITGKGVCEPRCSSTPIKVLRSQSEDKNVGEHVLIEARDPGSNSTCGGGGEGKSGTPSRQSSDKAIRFPIEKIPSAVSPKEGSSVSVGVG